jgi:predicted CopG family antitoxin
MTTIAIDPDVKKELANLKLVPEESYNSVIKRLIDEKKTKNEYKPIFPKVKKQGPKLTDEEFRAWLKKSIEEDKDLLIALGRE